MLCDTSFDEVRTAMRLLIGVPTHKRPDLLRSCLRSLEEQTGTLPAIHIFVVDNDPVGREGCRTVQQMAPVFRFPVSSVVVAERGLSAVRNAILAEARRQQVDFLAMIDDDEIASPAWLAELLKVQARFDANLVGGPVIRDMPGELPKWLRHGAFQVPNRGDEQVASLSGTGNMLACCRALKRLGWPGFHPAFALTGGEDLEWFTQLRKQGASFAWAAGAVTSEPLPLERTKLGWLLKRNFRTGATQMKVHQLHEPKQEIWLRAATSTAVLCASPLLALGLLSSRWRLPVMLRIARSAGRVGGLLGYQYQEYAGRHVARPEAGEAQAPLALPVRSTTT